MLWKVLLYKAAIHRFVSKPSLVVIHKLVTTLLIEAVAVLATKMFQAVGKGSETKNFLAPSARIAKSPALRTLSFYPPPTLRPILAALLVVPFNAKYCCWKILLAIWTAPIAQRHFNDDKICTTFCLRCSARWWWCWVTSVEETILPLRSIAVCRIRSNKGTYTSTSSFLFFGYWHCGFGRFCYVLMQLFQLCVVSYLNVNVHRLNIISLFCVL